MSAPGSNPDLLADLRAEIAERLNMACLYSETGQAYAEAGDDFGLQRAVCHLIIYARAAAAAYGELRSLKEQEAAHADGS